MRNIEAAILNPEAIQSAEKMMVCAARLTQRGESIHDLDDFLTLYDRPHTDNTIANMTALPHPTIQKFEVINVVVVGASRRFLAQITRHQNEVKFMSASLQYSDYSFEGEFVTPYELIGTELEQSYLEQCNASLKEYEALINIGVDNDAAGYMMPQGLRNVLIISATPYQWKHMIRQRICRRNTPETRYIMLRIWELLYKQSPALFYDCGPFCMQGGCKEGKMSCKRPFDSLAKPVDILKSDFPKLMR